MTLAAADIPGRPVHAARGGRLISCMEVAIGASGAPTATADHPGFSITRNTTGVYDLVYPACDRCFIKVSIKSAATTVSEANIVAKDEGAGTAQFETALGSAPTTPVDPASGDQLDIFLVLDGVPGI